MMIYDLIVIGSGPAGYLGAERAAQAGLKSLLFEKRRVGGVCLNEGCIPTKTLLYSAKIKNSASSGQKYGVIAKDVLIDHPAVIKRKNKIIKMLGGGIGAKLKDAGVEVVAAQAVITGKNDEGYTVSDGAQEYTAKNLLIATGSEAAIPPIPGLTEAIKDGFALTSREILDIAAVPGRLVVIGGGVVGLEMASYFKSAGADVTVIEMLSEIGGGIDTDIAQILRKNLEKQGIAFWLGCTVTGISDAVQFTDTDGNAQSTGADKVLVCAGRRPVSADIWLDTIGVQTEDGAIVTDSHLRTNMPGVYAAGDVNGKSMLAHTAYREAEVAVSHMLGKNDKMRYEAIPAVIYTTPEVACAGTTEQAAKEKGVEVTAKRIPMNYSGRYFAENERGDGIISLVVDNQKSTLIGVHMIGSYVSEIIYGAAMMIENEMTIEQIKQLIFPHPTVCEIIREAVFQI